MKRGLILTAFFASGYALPVGNPADGELYRNGICWTGPASYECHAFCGDSLNLRVGFYGDYVFNRNLEVENESANYPVIQTTTLDTNAGWLVLNCWNWLDIFSTLGATNIAIAANGTALSTSPGVDGTLVLIEFTPYFSWSVGVRGTLFNWRCFSVGFEGQYFNTNPNINSFTRSTSGEIIYFNTNNSARYQEWQVAGGAVYQFKCGSPGTVFAPYAAFKWAGGVLNMGKMQFTFPGTNFNYLLRDLEPKKSWGYAIGVTATVCDAVGINVEGRWADEKAVSVIGQLRL